LAEKWIRMVVGLQSAGVAHGDLQHGNVLVVGGELYLIDYDGMYVPALHGQLSPEIGHRNCQHPARTEYDFAPQIDNFSAWVIWFSIFALASRPEHWPRHRGGDECLLFRRDDFLDPSNSALIRDLLGSTDGQVRAITELFISLQGISPLDVPPLDGNRARVHISASQSPNGTAWLADHLPGNGSTRQPRPEFPPVPEGNSHLPDVGWILDSMESTPIAERHRFGNRLNGVRVVLCGSLAATLIVALLGQTPAFAAAFATFGVLIVNLLICFARYTKVPKVEEWRSFKGGIQELRRQIPEHQSKIKAINSERTLRQANLANLEAAIAAQAKEVGANLQEKVNVAQAEMDKGLQVMAQEQRESVGVESRVFEHTPLTSSRCSVMQEEDSRINQARPIHKGESIL